MADNPQDSGNNRNATMLGVRALSDLNATLKTLFPIAGGTATSATAGSAVLPGNPAGFLVVTLLDGTSAKIPFYR